MQQFRFLDVVINSDALVNNLEQLLESCPLWFQSELIMLLPDIISDKQHQAIAEILNKILEDNSELINLILYCMGNLNLGKEYLDEYKEKTLNLLKTNVKVNAISAIIKYVLLVRKYSMEIQLQLKTCTIFIYFLILLQVCFRRLYKYRNF